jgi:HD-like signal output (HDOD) protein
MSSAAGTPQAIVTRDAIVSGGRSLPSSPQMLGGLCELLNDVNVEVRQVAEEIRLEPALSARVLRLSNSAAFGGVRLGSVEEAVTRVGLSEVLRLVGAATVTRLVDRSLDAYGITAARLRENLLLHALASEALAESAGMDRRLAYTAGLLRGIGIVVMNQIARNNLTVAGGWDAARWPAYDLWETEVLGVTSSEAAAIILEETHLPDEIVRAVRHHLRPDAAPEVRFASVLNLAGAITAEHGFALPGEVAHWTRIAKNFIVTRLNEEAYQAASAAAFAVFERQRAAIM